MNLLLPVILAPDPCILSSPWLPSLPPQFNLLIRSSREETEEKELCRKVDSESKGQFTFIKIKVNLVWQTANGYCLFIFLMI